MHALGRGGQAGRRQVLELLEEAKAKGAQPNVIMYAEVRSVASTTLMRMSGVPG
jgi:hypothetical protein